MAMAPQGQAQLLLHQHGQPNSSTTNRPEPFSGAGNFAIHMALYLTFLMVALALAIALQDYLLDRCHRSRRVHAGSGSGEMDSDPEDPALVYSAASTMLAGSVAECAICLADFADGDAIRVMPACRHGFHASCIEPWLAGAGRSSCPTCRAPAAVANAATAAAVQPDEATTSSTTNRREPYCGAGNYDARYVALFIVAALQTIALVLAVIDAIVRNIRREGK